MIVVVGSANLDRFVQVSALPRPGETVFGNGLFEGIGGKGVNQAIAAKRLGAEVLFIGCVGRDKAGERLAEGLRKEGVRAALQEVDQPSGEALIVTQSDGENTIVVVPGANQGLTADFVAKHLPEHASCIVTQLEIAFEAVDAAMSHPSAKTILNPAPASALPHDLANKPWLATPNEHEGRSLRREGLTVTTLGSRGARIGDLLVPAFSVETVDSAGAGDAFNGALAVALSEGVALAESVRFACAAAALSTTKRGTAEAMPYRDEVDRLVLSQ